MSPLHSSAPCGREHGCDRAGGKNPALSGGRTASRGSLPRTAPLWQMRSRRVVDALGPVTPHGVTAAWWPLRCKFGSARAGAESPLSCLQLARSWLAPGASGWLDPEADPESGPSAVMRACGEFGVSRHRRRETCHCHSYTQRYAQRGALMARPLLLDRSVGASAIRKPGVGDRGRLRPGCARRDDLCGLGVDGVVFWLRRGALRQGRGVHRRTAKRA
jgi:hypothetical protein